MQFEFNPRKVLQPDTLGFSVVECSSLRALPSQPSPAHQLAQILDHMGTLSASAQALKSVITTYSKCQGEKQTIFIKTDGYQVLGFLKVGVRKLFYHNVLGKIVELTPLCVLDFYVHESVQRGGIGKALFEKMLATTDSKAASLAYDRPSPKLIGFLRKHYGLSAYIPQNNNYVIFDSFFSGAPLLSPAHKRPAQIQHSLRSFGQRVLQQHGMGECAPVESFASLLHDTPLPSRRPAPRPTRNNIIF